MIRRRKENELVPEDYWLMPYPLGLSEEMERLFNDFRTDFDGLLIPRRFGIESARIPAVDLVDDGDSYRLHAEMPGIKKEDVTIEVGEREINISAETSEEKSEEKEDGGYIRRERRYSKFYRSLPLPEAVQSEKASAELKDGVLTITIPKASKPGKKSKKVEVK